MYPRTKNRRGYTLIELLAAMTAASILLASLAATIVVSTNLLETPTEDELAWRDRDIADRIAADLRYATAIDTSPNFGFDVTRANLTTGASETANYQSHTDGLTRQVNLNAIMQLDENAPSYSFKVDGFSAPTYIANTEPVRVRATSSSTEPDPVSSITCDYPAGCQDGDMIVMAVVTNAVSTVVTPGWTPFAFISTTGIRCRTVHQIYDSANPGPVQVNLIGVSEAAVVMISLENGSNTDTANFVDFNDGFAVATNPASHPSPLEPSSGTLEHHLNIGVLAAVGNPWPNNTLGVASYTDAVQATTAALSVGMVVRNGPPPVMTTVPTYWHQTSGYWLQTAIRVGNGR